MMIPVRSLRVQSGMGLVEIMVGLVIGLIGLLVIFQTVSIWGDRAATTMSGGDAQTSGAVGVFYLERDIKQAGWGFGSAGSVEGGNVMGCNVDGPDYVLSPVVITSGATGAPDTITVLYGTSPIFTAAAAFKDGTASLIKTDLWGGFKTGDLAILGSGTACSLATIGASPSRDLPVAIASGGSALASGFAFNMGAAIVRARWEVDHGLRWGDNAATETLFPVADGVVDLQAEYGFDSDGDLRTGGITWQDPSVAVTNWNRLKAVRFAVLVRGKNYEKPRADGCPVTPVRPTWFGQNFTMSNLDGTANDTDVTNCTGGAIDVNDWHHYRYEVFERVVPLRNVVWGGIGE